MNNECDNVEIYSENCNFIELEVANDNADDYVLRINYLPIKINILNTYEFLEKTLQTKQIEKVLRECTDHFTLKENMVSLSLTIKIDRRSHMKPAIGINEIDYGFQKTHAMFSGTTSPEEKWEKWDMLAVLKERWDMLAVLKAFGEKKCHLIGDDTVVVSMDAIPIKSLIQVIFRIMFGIGYSYDAMMSDTVEVRIAIGYSIIPRNDYVDIADVESRIGSQLMLDALRS